MQNSHESDIQEIEISIEQARAFIALGDAIERLEKNPDFIKVVEQNYFTHEAARTVSLIAHPAQQRPDQQAALASYLRGISEFQQYLITTKVQVQQFRANLVEYEETLDDLRNSDGAEQGEEG